MENNARLGRGDGLLWLTAGGVAMIPQGMEVSIASGQERAFDEKAYLHVFESMTEGMLIVRLLYGEDGRANDFVFLAANSAYVAQTGRRAEALIGRRGSDILGANGAKWIDRYQEIAGAERGTVFEVHSDSVERWFRVSSMPLPEKDCYTIMFKDISETKRAEMEARNLQAKVAEQSASLAESESKYRTLFNSIDVGFCVIEVISEEGRPVDFRFIEGNRAFEEHTGFRNAIGKRMREIQPPLDSFWFETYGRIALTGEPVCLMHDAVRFSQNSFDIFAFRLGGEGSNKIAVIFNDVTKRKMAEDELKAERKRLFQVFDNLPAMICLITPDYHIPYSNRRFKETFGESKGRHCYEFCYGKSAPCEFCESFKVLETGKPHRWSCLSEDGIFIDAYDVPFTDIDGSKMILELDLDITDLRRAEQELKRSNAELQQFAYVASHDLQEPLRMVTAYLSLLNKNWGKDLNPKGRTYMDFALAGAERMRELIDDLLQYSRIDNQPTVSDEVDMNSVVEKVVENLQFALREANATIRIGPLPKVIVDRSRITMVMQNLISNAVKFRGPSPPLIEVSARRAGHEWVFAVKDNGIGIEEKYFDGLFKMFQRLHTKEEYPGTGIGLAMSKKVIEQFGGRIWVESEVGVGSTFFFSVPVHR